MIILGTGEFAEIAYHYLREQIGGFAVEREYLKESTLHGLPVVCLEDIPLLPAPRWIVNTVGSIPARVRLFKQLKEYRFWTFIHPSAFVDPSADIGRGSFIFENNTIQYGAKIGQNCVLWSGNHIGHSARIGDHCFITSHVVVSGHTEIGEQTYIGVNASFADGITVGEKSVIGMGAVVHKSLSGGKVYVGNPVRELRDVGEERAALPA